MLQSPMSLVDLLFPQAELEALGNRWHEPAPKRRKVDLAVGSGREQGQQQNEAVAVPRRHSSDSARNTGRHRLFTTTHERRRLSTKSHVSTVQRSNSEANPLTSSDSSSATSTSRCTTTTSITPPTSKSFLPDFIEPSLLQNYLQHLHPNDRSRYSVHNDNASSQARDEPRSMASQQHDEDAVSSPGLTADTSSPASSSDIPPTPSAGIFEQLHCGPFSHLIQGLRFTEHERDMVKTLLNPDAPVPMVPDEFDELPTINHKPETAPVHVLDDFYPTDEGFLHKVSPFADELPGMNPEEDVKALPVTNEERDNDVHSSGLSPGEDEDEKQAPAGIVMYDYSSLSDCDDGDLFDYDQAAGPSLATP